MGLDLSVSYISDNIDKKFINSDYEIEEDSVCLEYRLNMSTISEEAMFFDSLDCNSVLSILSYGLWEGFNGECYSIYHIDSTFVIESDEEKIVLKDNKYIEYKEIIQTTYNQVCKYKESDNNNYIANMSFLVLEMLVTMINTNDSEIFSNFS
jgi:hypothetical protein